MKHKKHNDARHYDEPEINEKETERAYANDVPAGRAVVPKQH